MNKKLPNPLNPGGLFLHRDTTFSLDPDPDGSKMQIAWERISLPRRVKALKDDFSRRLQALEDESKRSRRRVTNLKRSVRPGKRAADLKRIISGIKNVSPNLSQIQIAKRVDYHLDKTGWSFKDKAPKSWDGLPDRMADIFTERKYQKMRKLVRAYISKA